MPNPPGRPFQVRSDQMGLDMPARETIRFTPAQIVAMVDSAQASGRIGRGSRDSWLVRCSRGGAEGGAAVAQLLSLWPAGEQVDAATADPDSALYESLYPSTPPPGPPREPDWLRMGEERLGWLRSHAAAAASMSQDEVWRAMGYDR
jgi:hypothetical protein